MEESETSEATHLNAGFSISMLETRKHKIPRTFTLIRAWRFFLVFTYKLQALVLWKPKKKWNVLVFSWLLIFCANSKRVLSAETHPISNPWKNLARTQMSWYRYFTYKWASHLLYGNDRMGVNYFFAFHQFLPNLKRQKNIQHDDEAANKWNHHGSCSGTIQMKMFKRGGSMERTREWF